MRREYGARVFPARTNYSPYAGRNFPIASLFGQAIKRRRLTQAAAAALMGVDQPKVSAQWNGWVAIFSSERLMRPLTALGRDIDISSDARPAGESRAGSA